MDYTGQKFLQNCGDYLIIDKKSDKKERTRFLWEAHFEGYSKKLYVRQDNFSKGNVHNPEKPDKYGFLCDEEYIDKNIYFVWKNMERRCYDPNDSSYSNYGAKGVEVSNEFKVYSKFKNWYINNYGNPPYGVLELDKDCLSILKGLPNKMYSAETCLLIPSSINTFLSTLGKGIYLTKSKTFCVRLRRKYQKENKNFKDLDDAIGFKKDKDLEYIKILLELENIYDFKRELLEKYVKIFEYSRDLF